LTITVPIVTGLPRLYQ